MITKFKLYEGRKRGRPKDIWVMCKQDFYEVLNDEQVAANPQLQHNDRHVYQFFKKGEMYKMIGPLETINNNVFIVYVTTKIKHCIGPPNYPKFIYGQFVWYGKKERPDSDKQFEDYFEMPEETNDYIEYWKMVKNANKYNL